MTSSDESSASKGVAAALDEGFESQEATVVGKLQSVKLDTHRLQVTDDFGNTIPLPNVENDDECRALIEQYVSAVGIPERDSDGRISQIGAAIIQQAPPLPVSPGVRKAVPLEELLAGAPGPARGGVPGLTEEETVAFLEAIGR
ncbi:hypothetical protein C7K25_11020 [Gulosibacter molinativorax]|uniref:Uncharacterized protein n=1 Tax=Gulosibacter molinativorax TaxID=256821 RepID=A0ABT7C9J8_9MICO|nr:hypothetical protein [Gulosibacter molinativorax]